LLQGNKQFRAVFFNLSESYKQISISLSHQEKINEFKIVYMSFFCELHGPLQKNEARLTNTAGSNK